MRELAAVVGWDWANREHELSLREPGSDQVERRKLVHTPEALHGWAIEMLQRYGGRPVGVCIETSRGAVIWALMGYGHIVLYPVNPKSAASFREALYPSGKKDDPVDADVMALMLLRHQDKLRCFEPADPQTRSLAILSEHRRKLVQALVGATNRLGSVLKGYFPQALELVGELDTRLACDFLERWPALSSLKRVRATTLRSFYTSHGSRSGELIDARIALLQGAVPLTNDEALVHSGMVQARTLVRIIRALLDSIAEVERALEQLYRTHPEHDLIDSFPGAGPVMGSRLTGLLGSDRTRFEEPEELQRLTGVAPITWRTGGRNGTVIVHRRVKRPKFLHQTIIEWAGHSIRYSAWARAHYESQIAAGKGHYAALRSLGYKWMRILFRCWKTKTHYSETRHQDSLRRRGSPLVARLAA